MRVEELTAALVAVPSINPMGRQDLPLSGELALAEHLSKLLTELDAKVEITYPLPGRPNVTAFFDFQCRDTILFEAHLDTVPAADPGQFTPLVTEDRVFGRGACDCKGPMAAMLAGIARATGETPKHNALFVAVCDEEYQFTGVRHWLQNCSARWRPSIAYAVVAEPTELRPVVAHKGVVRWRAHSHGVAAHSSTPELGSNAIYTMAHFIEDLETLAAGLRSSPAHEHLGHSTLSVGTICGGTATNIVPAHCSIEIDRRLLPDETVKYATNQIRQLASARGVIVEEPFMFGPALETRLDSRPVEQVARAAADAGADCRPAYVNYCTDAGFYHAAGIQAVVFGPGDIAHAHTADEWISVDQLRRGEAAYAKLLCSNSGVAHC